MTTLDRLLTLLALDSLPRTGWLQAGVPAPESVAAHSLGVALVAIATADRVAPPLDVDRCVALCIVHDAPEALLGDMPRAASRLLPEGAKRAAEKGAAVELLGSAERVAAQRWAEYAQGVTREARFARACDKLHLGLRALGYARAGLGELTDFSRGVDELDCGEFEPLEQLRAELSAALRERLDRR
ncbi:HD domain-containing protein [Engelhardtia mirabilis]|uniref:5'-deoxynucleotidase n=1 Tax=Engelhardtia mirabilis TaxID=2528011 RepID=A0A518BRV6_9BACT|nr:hypothetical protein Pla133_48230 [Planctomycetes bacterium Pla133]QDV04028.1 hypothetical protein Pla86_48210 [Planctomycetes bacterium Pla86]